MSWPAPALPSGLIQPRRRQPSAQSAPPRSCASAGCGNDRQPGVKTCVCLPVGERAGVDDPIPVPLEVVAMGCGGSIPAARLSPTGNRAPSAFIGPSALVGAGQLVITFITAGRSRAAGVLSAFSSLRPRQAGSSQAIPPARWSRVP